MIREKMSRKNVRNRLRTVLHLLTVLVTLFCLPEISFGEKIVVYSAVYPPYQIDDNGKLTGVNTEIVRAIFHNSGIPFEIQYVPWARAQKLSAMIALTIQQFIALEETNKENINTNGLGFISIKRSVS